MSAGSLKSSGWPLRPLGRPTYDATSAEAHYCGYWSYFSAIGERRAAISLAADALSDEDDGDDVAVIAARTTTFAVI